MRLSEARAPVDASDLDGEVAKAAGTAVHRVLEQLRFEPDLRAELARHAERAPRAARAARLAARRVLTALERAQSLLGQVAQASFAAQLVQLRDHVIARELPVLLPADADGDGPVGFVAGAIDLLFRDPATGEIVIVDYKTDRVENGAALERPRGVTQGRLRTTAGRSRRRSIFPDCRASNCGSCTRAPSCASVDTRAKPTLAWLFSTRLAARGGAS